MAGVLALLYRRFVVSGAFVRLGFPRPMLRQSACGRGWLAGDGFVTDQSVVNSLGVSDATPFLSAVVSKPYRNQACQLLHFSC